MRFRSMSLRAKINLGLFLLLLLFSGAMAFILLAGFERTQSDATASSRAGLEEQSRATLELYAASQASVGQLQFNSVADLSLLGARYLADAVRLGGQPADPASRLVERDGIVYDPRLARQSDIWYAGGLPLEGAPRRDFEESGAIEALLQTMYETEGLSRESNFDPVAVYFIGTSGLIRRLPATGIEQNLDPDFQPLATDVFQLASPTDNPARQTVWTPPHDDPKNGLLISAVTPVYVRNEFRGVVAVDLSLQKLADQVDLLRASPSGFAFYVDSSGQLLPTANAGQVQEALTAEGSEGLANVLASMRLGETGTKRARIGLTDVFISYSPITPVGGSLGIVAPVEELTRSARDVASSIEEEGNRTMAATLITLATLLIATIGFSTWLNRRVIITPLEALLSGTNAVAAGDLTTTIPVRSDDELGDLARSFNRMTAQLASGRQQLEEKEAQFRGIFEATRDGVIINDPETGAVVDANPAACEMHGYPREEFIGLGPQDFVHHDSLPIFEEYLAALREGRSFRARAVDIRRDGSQFHVEVTGSRLEYQGRVHYLGVVRDISEQMRAFELLEERVDERTRELSTLLRVSRDVGATLDLDTLLGSILERLHEVIDYNSSSVIVDQDERLTIVYSRAEDTSTDARVRQAIGRSFPKDPANRIWSQLSRGEPVVIDDVRGNSVEARAYRQAVGDLESSPFSGVRAWMAVPLTARENVLGFLTVSRTEPAFFNEHHAEVASAFAAVASRALENAQLFAQAQRRARENAALADVAALFTVDQEMSDTLDALANSVCESTSAIAATIVLVGEDGGLIAHGESGQPEGYMERVTQVAPVAGGSALLEAAQTGATARLPDVRTLILGEPAWQELWPLVEGVKWEGVVATPLIYRGRSIGALGTYYPEGEMPREQELAFLQALADQAAIGVENLRLFAAARARTQELEALYRSDEQLHRSLELAAVTQAIVDVAVEYLGADGASFTVWDDASGQPRVRVAGHALRMARNELIGELAQHRLMAPEEVAVRAVENIEDAPDIDQENARRAGVKSFIRVPVVVSGRLFGIFDSAYTTRRNFRAEDLRLFSSLAQRAGIAIENAQLFESAAQRTRQIDALYRADEALHRSLVVDDVLQALSDVALDVLEADRTMFVGWLPAEEFPVIRAASGGTPEMREALAASFRHISREEFERREVLSIGDAENEPAEIRARLELANVRAAVEMPIFVDEVLFGVFYLGWEQPRAFTPEDQRIYAALAQRAAVAVENAQLYEQAQNLAAVEERQRLARELHDSVSQALYGIALGARTTRTLLDRDPERAREPVDYVLSLAEAGLAEMRALIFELRPESLANEGIIRAIEKHIAGMSARYGVQFTANLPDDEPEVPLPVKEAIYRIVQEAIHNTIKHAKASEITIDLALTEQAVVVDVRDNGEGFDPTGDFPGHLGLKSMRERATRLGGSVTIESAPGAGTRVSARIPR